MSLNKPKRPSSARRNIRQETFSCFVSATRLRHVQSLLNDGSKATKDYPDAILCIAGIDSRYNDGMLELINYLLFGFFEIRMAELEGSGFDEEVIDDVMFLIQRDKVDVYCNPINYHYLLPYVSHWRNVYFHCLTDTEYEDEEKAEDFKVTSFASIVKNCNKIGIPYSNSANLHKFDIMLIEKWPIIQIYGVEGVGSGGFFTMQHEVTDVSEQVHKLYNYMDPVALENMVVEQVSKLERQWQTMLSTVDVSLSGSNHGALTEKKCFEPLKSFYVHGRASNTGNGDGPSKADSLPYLLFGKNSTKQMLDGVQKALSMPSGDLKSTLIGTHEANFMVCRAVSPRGPVTCSRTYFFNKQFVNPFQESKVTEYEASADLRLLTFLYGSMVDAVLTGIQAYCNTLSLKQAEEVAEETLYESCSGAKDDVVSGYVKTGPRIHFTLQAVDHSGCMHSLTEGTRNLMVKCASFTLYDIPSYEKSGTVLGSLVFSETFLDSEIKVSTKDGSVGINSSYLLLTDHIPRYHCWTHTGLSEDKKLFQTKLEDKSLSEHFGALLLSGDPINLGCASTLCMPPEEASLFAFENGLVILCEQYGAIVLHGNHIRSARFYDGDTSNTVAVLVIEYHSTFVPFIPFHLRNEEGQLMLMFTPKSKAYKHLYSQVLHTWREDADSPKVKVVSELPENCHLMHSLIQHHHSSTSSNRVKTALQKASVSLPHLYKFLDHFSASSVGWYPVPETDLRKVLRLPKNAEIEEEPEIEIVVAIISGIPGSHQEQMCDVLSKLSKDQNRYVILKPPLDGSQQFNPVDIQAKLKATLNVHRRRKQSQANMLNTRVLYIVPGYTDIVSVVQAVECHPDVDVRSHCVIGSVTACVDPLNVYMEHKLTFPYLLNACEQGWVNQIVMTSSTALKNDDLEEVQHMLRSVNSDVAFLLAEQGNVSRSMDLDAILSEDSFHQSEKVRARYLLCPGWRQGPNRPLTELLNTVHLKFTLPLDRNKLVAKLRGMKATLSSYPFSGNIYNVQGKVKFTGAKPEESIELHYTTMSGVLSMRPYSETAREKAQNSSNFMVFTGSDLSQPKLKDWLRDCAPKKPEKKDLILRKDITRDVKNKIHKEHHLDPLPEGWFYNGTQYVSFDGTKQDQHPNLEEFVNDYVAQQNVAVTEYNKKVEEMMNSYRDLFS
ncbi:dynein axonemal assembly factor 9-like isoform X1 [Mercenaria mercenaria]|uniref:dynein axonemal assembly factor 9-like isoform X1 n=1 Tax=Mercenaria mercenaria TaxID=6596 RepID=UPI00234EAF24|nr:dynein axonemal assembly factor 9-like isoform X1 [Mercenaria mercenaria]